MIDADATEIAAFIQTSLNNAAAPIGSNNTGTGSSTASPSQLYADLCSSCHGDDPAYDNFGILVAATDAARIDHYFVKQDDAAKIVPFIQERKAAADTAAAVRLPTPTTTSSSTSSGGALTPLWLMLLGLIGLARRRG
ncbi:MAG: GlyGly-CTERM sorting domain-containing protein [Gammaproteobacteria bacterium]|nr:GlyGly-CTERM sorting domain-containing protein [Gammaproteobacteria bacterium]